jgi:hypothetical protein
MPSTTLIPAPLRWHPEIFVWDRLGFLQQVGATDAK